jgi:hypothetical protein
VSPSRTAAARQLQCAAFFFILIFAQDLFHGPARHFSNPLAELLLMRFVGEAKNLAGVEISDERGQIVRNRPQPRLAFLGYSNGLFCDDLAVGQLHVGPPSTAAGPVSVFRVTETAVHQAEHARRDEDNADDLCDAHGDVQEKPGTAGRPFAGPGASGDGNTHPPPSFIFPAACSVRCRT